MKKMMQQAAYKMLQHQVLDPLADSVEPSCFGDPLAERTRWNPLTSGGANFHTHKLVSIQPDRMEFRIAAGMLLFALIFFLAGVGVTASALLSAEKWPLLLLGLIFLLSGGGMLYFSSAPVVFDKRKGFFWKGRKSPDDVADLNNCKHCVRLGEIHALQIVKIVTDRADSSSYSSYELNLVLKDASRINVVNYGSSEKLCEDASKEKLRKDASKEKLREDAAALAAFLGKPLWDATEMTILDAVMPDDEMMEAIRKMWGSNPELLDEKAKKILEKLNRRLEKMA